MKKDSTDLSKGMIKQPTALFNPNSTYNYALNAMLGSREGDTGGFTNEEGNQICFTLPNKNSSVIGHVLLDDNNSIIFIADGQYSYIGLFDPEGCNFTVLIKSECLNFQKHKQIDALSRVVRGCERVIYFTDNFNSYRSLNIEKLELYLSTGFATPAAANLDPANGWNCELFKHFSPHNVPCIELDTIENTVGNLKPGVVQFAIRYIDNNLFCFI